MHRKQISKVGGWLIAASVVGGSLVFGASAAQAAVDQITVTNLNLSGPGSLKQAVIDANASSNSEGVRITFAESLAGTGELELSNIAERMGTTTLNPGSENTATGAWFVVDNAANAPVSIDFTNLDGINGYDHWYAGFDIESDGVSLSNLANLEVGESGIAVRGTGTSITNVELKDPDSWNQEVGVLLMDGATDTTLTDVTVYSPYWGSVVVDNEATVTNTVITGLTSRGVENYGHVMFEDRAVVNGFSVSDSVLGAPEEIAPGEGFYVNPGVELTGLSVTGTTFQSPNEDGVFFLGGAQKLTDTVFDGNTFGGNAEHRIADVVAGNTAEWNNLTFTGNTVSHAGGTLFGGAVNTAEFSGNTFLDVDRPFAAALQFSGAIADVAVSENSFTDTWSDNGIFVTGASADNVAITGNTLTNTYADVSRAAINIASKGAGNTVSDNTLTQDLSDTTLPGNIDNHWAIHVSASAPADDQQVGWTVTNNTIDGFGGKDRSEAPITFAGTGKLPVTGNTFGTNTRGGTEAADLEHSGYWFLWNVWDSRSNHTVQTYRAEQVAYTGANARFTAVDPAPLIGNNAATGPVTLHVYWTAADNAEEYLGAIEDVTAGERVSIPTTHTDGFIRVQTVDANGYTSQYSGIDPKAPVTVTAPVVTETTDDGATGTGTPEATVVVRDADGTDVTDAVVDAEGNWSVSDLECGKTYTVVQVVDGAESQPTEFTTADCPVVVPEAPVVTKTTDDGATGTGTPEATVVVRDADGTDVTDAVVDAEGNW
ncbi:right-handed parallel beta-helix repeat-containing protein, partial [Leucobacter zeae]|nr:right-handed parallel beta-helix repeat-containing protein [Leucobacter zeae]